MKVNGYPRSLVHRLIASQLRVGMTHVSDDLRFDDIGLQLMDLVMIVLRLEQFDRGRGDFPLAALERAATVGDLVLLVDLWLQRHVRACPRKRHRAHVRGVSECEDQMNRPDLAESLENVRCDVAAAVQAWREAGGKDDDLALVVDGLHSIAPLVAAMARTDVPWAVPAFDPVTAIELARHPPHLAPVVIDLPLMARRIVWADIGEHERPSAAVRRYWQTSAVRFTAR